VAVEEASVTAVDALIIPVPTASLPSIYYQLLHLF